MDLKTADLIQKVLFEINPYGLHPFCPSQQFFVLVAKYFLLLGLIHFRSKY